MEVLPGVGVALVHIGQPRSTVEVSLGPPRAVHGRTAHYDAPVLIVDYDEDGLVELVQVPYSGVGDEATLADVQLTYRFMDDVLRDLTDRGYRHTSSDIGYDFEAGFALFSMSSLDARAIDPDASEDDPRGVVEGVAVAPYAYFHRA